jgi:hypothetical protein
LAPLIGIFRGTLVLVNLGPARGRIDPLLVLLAAYLVGGLALLAAFALIRVVVHMVRAKRAPTRSR